MRLWIFIAALAASFVRAQDADPDQVALRFAEGLRDGLEREKLATLTALNPDTGDRKKDQIFASWKSEEKKFLPQAFEVVDQKISGDYGGVVLRQQDPKQSALYHLFSVAVVKRDQRWRAAPTLSSFQNTIVSYDDDVIALRRNLEQWMLTREISLREEMQSAARRELREKMEASVSPDALKKITARELVDGLITAVRSRDQAAVMARLGGYSVDDVPEWDRIQRRIGQIFSGDGFHAWPWRLLTSRTALSAIGDTVDLGDENVIDMLVLHPEGVTELPDLLSFTIQRDAAGVARIVMPEIFFMNQVSEEEMGDVMDYDVADHQAMYEDIRKQARKDIPEAAFADAEMLSTVVEKCLQGNDFARYWGVGAIPGNTFDEEDIPELVMQWQSFQGTAVGSSLFGRAGFMQQGDTALFVVQAYTPRSTDTMRLLKIWFSRKNNAWRMLGAEPEEPPAELTKWWEANRKAWSAKLSESITADIVRIGGLPQEAPEPGQVRAVFDAWLLAVQERSLSKALSSCAAFQDDRSMLTMLRSLAGELMYTAGQYKVLAVNSMGRWTTVSAKYLSDKPKSTPQYSMYVFANTEKGPRLLPQLELRLSLVPNRSRVYLNNLTFTDLKKVTSDAAVDELKKLYEQHEELVKQESVIKP
jgi:hypothetical protein